MLHNFENSLVHELAQTIAANLFYRTVIGASQILRFDTDSERDMEQQLQDVDLDLVINNVTYHVSEKFRDKDYGDLYIEIFSKYPHSAGWIYAQIPNALLYFTPTSVYWITHKSLVDFCLEKLLPNVPDQWFDELFLSNKTIISKQLNLKNESISLNLIQAHNKATDGARWNTIGISAPFSFFEKNGVKIKKFDRM
jgi:hypothetical protein